MNHQIIQKTDNIPAYQLYLRAGLTHQVLISPKVREALHLPAVDDPELLDLMWVVRGVLTGLLPVVERRTNLGHAKIAEFFSFSAESSEPVERKIAVVELEERTVLVALPEELTQVSGKPLVLLAEDDVDVRQLVTLILQAVGVEVVAAADGAAAWDILQNEVPDLVLTDVDMPRLNGLELCRRIKADVRLKNIPVLLWSGYPGYETTACTAGATAFLCKPIRPQDLVAIIEQHLKS